MYVSFNNEIIPENEVRVGLMEQRVSKIENGFSFPSNMNISFPSNMFDKYYMDNYFDKDGRIGHKMFPTSLHYGEKKGDWNIFYNKVECKCAISGNKRKLQKLCPCINFILQAFVEKIEDFHTLINFTEKPFNKYICYYQLSKRLEFINNIIKIK